MTVNITEKKSVMYFDGIEKSSDTYSGNLVNCNSNLPLGGTYRYLQGYLDDVRLYHRALSAGEIQYLYTKTQARYK